MSDDNQQGGSIGQTREKIEKQIDKLIDNYATKIPVASQYKDKAKAAIGTFLQKLEERGERRLGGLFKGNKNS
jgi:hypothetical protein